MCLPGLDKATFNLSTHSVSATFHCYSEMATKNFIIFALLGILVRLNVSQALPQEQKQLIDAAIAQFQEQWGIQGSGLTIVQNGETVLVQGYGKRNVADDLDVENNTLFSVGSVSKGITSLLVVKTLSELFPELGASVLDTPIIKLGTNLNFTLLDRYRSALVTFKDLLSHRTCLYNDNMIIQFQAATYDEFVYRSRYDNEQNYKDCSFRNGLVYNNAMYALAGSLIGKLAGSSYAELLTNLYRDLEMTSSRVLDAEGSHEDLPNMSRAYTWLNEDLLEFNRTHLRKFSAVGGAGGVLSTPEDMGKYLQFHLNKGQVNGKQIVPEDVLSWLYKVVVPVQGIDFATLTGSYGYGLGHMVNLFLGEPHITHPGHLSPFASSISLFPQSQVGIFYTDNGPGATGMGQPVLHLVLKQILAGQITTEDQMNQFIAKMNLNKDALYFDIEPFPKLYTDIQRVVPKNAVKHRLHPIDLVGIYGSPKSGELSIEWNYENPETLRISYGVWGIGLLHPRNNEENVFDLEFTTTVGYDFLGFGLPSYPPFDVYFITNDELQIVTPILPTPITFVRDATLDTYPEIPWSPDSCVP